MEDRHFTPVTITRAVAEALPVRHGYTTLVYRLSAPVSGAWLARFEAACQASVAGWPYDRPLAFADRLQVLLPDHDHADRAALDAIKAHLEAAITAANRGYRQLAPEAVAAAERASAWERRVLATLQAALDEQFPG